MSLLRNTGGVFFVWEVAVITLFEAIPVKGSCTESCPNLSFFFFLNRNIRRFEHQTIGVLKVKGIRKKVHLKKKSCKIYKLQRKIPRKRLINLAKISIWKCCFIFGTYIQLHFIWELFTDPIPETTLALKNADARRPWSDLSLRARWTHLALLVSGPGTARALHGRAAAGLRAGRTWGDHRARLNPR